jgi:hypothetical protein
VTDAPVDGRQSERALAIRRGTLRLLAQMDCFALPEVTLASERRADLMAVDPAGKILIIEIKSSRQDFLVDRKWRDYGDFCDRFFFATSPEVEAELFPEDCGLIVADAFGGAVMRECPRTDSLAAARRKAILILLSRLGAARLSGLADPGLRQPE